MENNLPEAGAVAFFSYKRPDGFIISLTLRDKTGKEVLERIEGALEAVKTQGGVPHEKNSGGFPKKEKDYVQGEVCPKCGSRLVNQTTKTGKKMQKCETNKWNAMLNRSEGCDYVKWL